MLLALNITVAAFRRRLGLNVLALVFSTFWGSVCFAQSGIISGVVKNGKANLPSASISIENRTILTDSTGAFSISIARGMYVLRISHAGHTRIEQPVTIDSGETRLFEFTMIAEGVLGEVVVLGSRSAVERSSLNTPVPVDLISSKNLQQTAQHTLIQMMNFAAPSFNVSRQNLFEPVTLRGLGPDHLLILVNGTRYHNTAYLNDGGIRGTLGLGSVTNDLNSIPFSAIEKIEILRDGASAQYGSDAIGGVMNIVLKKTTDRTFINLQLGKHYKGDGHTFAFGINRGIVLNKKGFLNYSGDFRYRMPTHRGGEYNGTVYYNIPLTASRQDSLRLRAADDSMISARGFSRKTPVSNDGSIKLSSVGFLINGAYPINKAIELFWTGTINYRSAMNEGAYRFPKTISQVNTELYPDGFKTKPVFNSRDVSLIAGLRGKTYTGWNWEWNSVFGKNSNKQFGTNTNNASQFMMGANAPTEFYGGGPLFIQQTNTVNFFKDLAKKIEAVKTFTVGFGAEYRFENYLTRAGEEASWNDYDSSGIRMGGAQGSLNVNPRDVVDETRHMAGLYAELETDINDHLLINVTGRYEHYSDFGSNLAGKLALRYKFTPAFMIRGSLSNGYHAPALQQFYFTATGFAWKNMSGFSMPVTIGTFSNNSDISRAFGVKPLTPERAVNAGGGFTSTFLRHISLTVDAYWIQIKNRIVLSGVFDKSNPDVNSLLQSRPDIDRAQFITNAINTKTRGIDIVLNGNWEVRKATLGMMAAANFTETKIFGPIQFTDKLPANDRNANTLFNREERGKIEHGQPGSKIILSANYARGKIYALIRGTRFGQTSVVFNSDDRSQDETFSAKTLVDFALTYRPTTVVTLSAGINNVFDVYPDRVKNPINTNQGSLIYSNQGTPFAYNGGYYFLNMAFSF